MARLAVPVALALALASFACARTKTPAQAALEEIPFDDDDERAAACASLRDHVVKLYADEMADQTGIPRDPVVRARFREHWMRDLERRGNVHKFNETCTRGLTKNKFECGIQSRSTNELDVCLKLG